MAQAPTHDITNLLHQWRDGEQAALDELMPLVYQRLRQLAASQLRFERANHTLEPTALVHEAYLRLAGQREIDWQNRAHFFGAAVEVMRRVLVDYARRKKAEKRGDGAQQVSLSVVDHAPSNETVDVLALDEALTELARLDPQQCRLVELRYFGGLSIEETAEVLGLSPATVKRHWLTARAWLFMYIRGVGENG